MPAVEPMALALSFSPYFSLEAFNYSLLIIHY